MTLDPDPRYVPEEPVQPTIRSRHSRDPLPIPDHWLAWLATGAAVGVVVGLLLVAVVREVAG